DGTALPEIPTNDVAGTAGLDYQQGSGTLGFYDFEMSKTIFFSIVYEGLTISNQSNRVFGMVLSNPQRDPYESPDVSQPRLDPKFSTAMVRILNVNADPYGTMVQQVSTNGFSDPPTNTIPILVTNLVNAPY